MALPPACTHGTGPATENWVSNGDYEKTKPPSCAGRLPARPKKPGGRQSTTRPRASPECSNQQKTVFQTRGRDTHAGQNAIPPGMRPHRSNAQRRARLAEHSVFEGLGWAQPHDGLGLDLDGLAGLRVAAHARLTVRLHRTAQPGDDELARAALEFFHRQL